MATQLTQEHLDQKLDELATAVQRGFQGVTEQFKGVAEQFQGVTEQFKGVNARMIEMDQRLTREIKELDKKLVERLDALTTNVDGFITLHKKLDIELTAMRSKYSRLESHLQFVAKHLNLALPE